MMGSWEYFVEDLVIEAEKEYPGSESNDGSQAQRLDEQLSELGAGGWELVTVVPVAGHHRGIFKRPK